MPNDVGARCRRLKARRWCVRSARRAGRARHAAALEAIDTSESEGNSTGVTPYTASFGDAARFRGERRVARRLASHRTYPESPKMITFSRVRLRDAMVPGSSRCAGRTREWRERSNDDDF